MPLESILPKDAIDEFYCKSMHTCICWEQILPLLLAHYPTIISRSSESSDMLRLDCGLCPQCEYRVKTQINSLKLWDINLVVKRFVTSIWSSKD